jgi:anti-sigma factor RsiW
MSPPAVCRDGVALLFDYLEGTLRPAERHAVDRHLAGCRRCRSYVRSYAAVPRIVSRATAAAPPPGLRRRLLARVGGRRH